MKLMLILTAMLLSTAAFAETDADSEGTVIAAGYNPAKKDCNCAQPVQNTLPANNRGNDVRVVNFLTDPSTPGAPPSFDSTTTH